MRRTLVYQRTLNETPCEFDRPGKVGAKFANMIEGSFTKPALRDYIIQLVANWGEYFDGPEHEDLKSEFIYEMMVVLTNTSPYQTVHFCTAFMAKK